MVSSCYKLGTYVGSQKSIKLHKDGIIKLPKDDNKKCNKKGKYKANYCLTIVVLDKY